MKILLNGEPLDISGLTETSTITDVLEALENFLEQTGMTVMEIEADGEVFFPDHLEDLAGQLIQRYEQVEFRAMTAAELVCNGVQDSLEALSHLEDGTAKVASSLRLGHVKEAMTDFVELLDGLEWLTTVIRNLERGFPQAFVETSLEAVRVALLERWETQITEARNAQEAQDWVGLADLIEYEFTGMLSESHDFLNAVIAADSPADSADSADSA